MAVDKSFLIRSIQKKESLIVAFCSFTNMPYVVCDPETFNDQVFIFDTDDQLKEFGKKLLEDKIAIKGIKYPNNAFLPFFSMLFSIGINELVFVNASGKETIELETLVKRPDYSKLPKEQQPVFNPELQLTGLYFMQEASRPIPNEQKPGLKDLEEELAANLVKAKYIVPVEFMDGPETDMEKIKNNKYRLPLLKNKNGDAFQPIFTDPNEMAKFNRENKFRALVMPFASISKVSVSDAKGFMLNPGGFHIQMPKELLTGLKKRFGIEEN